MTKNQFGLGGRIPLREPRSLTVSTKQLYDAILEYAVPWSERSGFAAKLPDGRLIGPFNVALHCPEISSAFAALQRVEESKTTLDARIRQTVILTVGAVWECDYERYAHAAVARGLGLPSAAIEALAHGNEPQGLTEKEMLAVELTRQIATHHRISQDLFDRAQAAFGNQGIVDLLFLAGCYFTVSSLLNTFEVPVPEDPSSL